MSFYNVSDVRNFAPTDPRLNNYAESFPNNDSEGSTHQEMYVVKRKTLCLNAAFKRAALKNKYDKAVATYAVGETIGLFNIPSDSEIRSVTWDVQTTTGLVGKLVLVDESNATVTPLSGILKTRITTTETSAAGNGDNVGVAVSKNVLLLNQWVGATKYIAFQITALPADWKDCPRVPDICFNVNDFNHLTSYTTPNV